MAALGEWGVRRRPEEADGYELDEDDDDGDGDDGGDADGFTLDEVLRLGGTKQDFLMLCGVDEAEEMVDGGKKGAIDDLKEGELEAFIGSLGLGKYAKGCLDEEEEEEENEEKKGSKEKEKIPKKEKSKKEKSKEKSKKETVAPSSEGKKEKKTEEQVSSRKDSKKKLAGGGPRQQQSVQKERLEEDFTFRAREVILIKPGGKWYDLEYTGETSAEPQDPALLSQYKALAQKLYQHETELYKSKTEYQKGASSAWMKTVVSSGTLADRMAAMTLLIQDSAVHSLHFVENLVNLVKKKGSRQQSLMALDTFRELLLSDLLPDTRKLWSFSQRPFNNIEKMSSGNRDSRDRRLILWYFEHQLKLLVAEFVQTLEALSHDSLTATKTRALAAAHELLCNKPEQEKFLLVQLVNKLGDPQNKIATKASYLLETLLHKHPNMKGVVCSEVERLLYRTNISAKTQYYAMCFLNQIVLSHEETPLANKLITLYFCFFRNCIKKKDVESKMLSALLSGVNRAYPYAEIGDEKVKEQMNTLFKVLHLVNFSTSVQALMLLFQVMDSQQTVSDRYYAALYKKLLDPGLATCSKPSMFLNLVYKSLKADVVLRRVKAFVKRLLQVTTGQTPPFICGTLYLLSELLKVKPGLRVQLQDHVESDEEECFKDQEETEENEETFVDADKVEREERSATENSAKRNNLSSAASWVHHENMGGRKNGVSYDPLHRSPLYCGAESTSLWELKKLSEHFHPSVALFAKTILEGNHIQYSGDPLQDFTLMRFLDRFVYRNPKLHKGKENTSSVVMQRKKKQFMTDTQNLAVNSKEFLARDESKIPVDELFFHRFYTKFDKTREKHRRQEDEESVEDVDDDEFERALDTFEADGAVGVGQDDLDFAGNIKKKSNGNKKSKRSEESGADWEDSDDEEFSDLDDEEVSLGSMEEDDFEEDMDEEGGVFMDVSDDGNGPDLNNDNQSKSVSKKTKRKKDMNFMGSHEGSSQGKKRKLKDAKILAAAEEIGYLLDENAGSKFDNIGMNAMANRDNANIKQIKWELERDRWLHNRDVKSIIKRKKQLRHTGLKKKYRGKKSKR
ncbi:CCAAT/enhancer-binding protein zeta isoform 2 [Gallus gallus]|uniref:CCAAT/enhancer-binding protein zeta isoform 2 n=1 Tax=Gallus gallus TaxID=9031 RepID=UPI001D020E01|nr:CCAAT/enhancer-binding protein zeta isoform 2 [Gallus gallus]